MHTLFISDIHLSAEATHTTKYFLEFLSKEAKKADALYILGDLFDAWLGDDDDSLFNRRIEGELRRVIKAGTPIYFMYGNRDFLIGRDFFERTKCQWIPDPTVIDLYGTRTLLMHGDTLCSNDKRYMLFRKWVRKPFIQRLFLMIPIKQRRGIANRLRHTSFQYQQQIKERSRFNPQLSRSLDATPSRIVKMMQKHQADLLIHGHTHQPGTHKFTIEGKPAMRIVLGAWHRKGSVLYCDKNGEKQLKPFGE